MYNRKEDVLPHEVLLSIQRVLESNPPHLKPKPQPQSPSPSPTPDAVEFKLDSFGVSEDFDVVQILNAYFPDEASLSRIEAVQAQLARDELALQDEIEELQVMLRKDQDPARMQLIQEMISDLLTQISRIREKASESEAVVRNITADIQVLDLAKRNLVESVKGLRRLGMLVNALSQLEEQVKEKRYFDIIQSLGATTELSVPFKPYNQIPHVAQLMRRFQIVQGVLREGIQGDFQAFYARSPNSPTPNTLNAACLVANLLSAEVRKDVVDMYVGRGLKEWVSFLWIVFGLLVAYWDLWSDGFFRTCTTAFHFMMVFRFCCWDIRLYALYRRVFARGDEAGGLDNVGRRFRWFSRVLGGAFGSGFGATAVPQTQTQGERGEGESEGEMVGVFPDEWKVDWCLIGRFVELTREDIAVLLSKAGSTLSVKLLLDTLQQTLDFEAGMARRFGVSLQEILTFASQTLTTMSPKPISSAFEPHLGVFVDAQDKAISDLLYPHRHSNPNKQRPSLDSPTPPNQEGEGEGEPVVVLGSSTELFYLYGQVLEGCAKYSRGKALKDLCGVCKKWLRVYAEDVLIASLKRPGGPVRRSIENRLDMNELKTACLLVNTADYCQRTALELEEKMKEKLNDEYKEQLSLQAEQDLFVSVISTSIQSLVHLLELATEPSFTALSRTPWSSINQVSGQSPYVGELMSSLERVVGAVVDRVEQKKYVRNFLDKVSSLVFAKFTNALVKSRPLRDVGAEQLLIDLQAIKACLLKIPGESLASSSYARSVTKSTTRLETLLKVIVTPVDPPEGFILNYTLLIGDASFSNFQKVLDLKGTPKQEQNHLLDSFVTITSTKPELEDASFLSSLDMDPHHPAQRGMLSPSNSRMNLPSLLVSGADSAGESIFAALGSPPISGPPTGSDGSGRAEGTPRRDVFMDVKRFVSFGLRRDSAPPQ
ncbi:hypothetical protein JAAARDRAFT_208588 [Jaapia argillacea MUCL 33604]|uniref:Vps53 N-terminal domain-containing protein n=1 Tax=Jaapia argillacea MUCL 33604 TaxID=933084 RepID=A0A067PZP5_9AGAM|nr:hypothetical protein JAAARDRAFT_208588 [Jaapia argillacea MUCL 33604]